MTDDGYHAAAPRVRARMVKFERVLDRVRATHRGRPVSEVLEAVEVEAAAESIEVWREVAEEVARLISAEGPEAR